MNPHRPRQTQHQKLQQDILNSLDAARCSGLTYPGGGNGIVRTSSATLGQELFYAVGWERIDAITFRLPDGVYDMRETLRYMARERNAMTGEGDITETFKAKFSAAVRGKC